MPCPALTNTEPFHATDEHNVVRTELPDVDAVHEIVKLVPVDVRVRFVGFVGEKFVSVVGM